MTRDIHTLWIGDHLSSLERICLSSFLYHGHSVTVHTFTPDLNVPAGVRVLDASPVWPFLELRRYANGSVALTSNYMRWAILQQYQGAIWVDADVLCLRPFSFTDEWVFAWQNDRHVAIGVVGGTSESPILEQLKDLVIHPYQARPYDRPSRKRTKFFRRIFHPNSTKHIKWGEAGGVYSFHNEMQLHNLLDHALPESSFYPLPADEFHTAVDGTCTLDDPRFETSFAIHLWNERFRRGNIDKEGPFPEGSLLAEAKRVFGG